MQFVRTYRNQRGVRIIRIDQGGDLVRSTLFRKILHVTLYSIGITCSDNSSQNGITEQPYHTLANMVRTGLENSVLSLKYWSDALLHAVYIKNH